MYFPKAILLLLAFSVSQAVCAPIPATNADVTSAAHQDHLMKREPGIVSRHLPHSHRLLNVSQLAKAAGWVGRVAKSQTVRSAVAAGISHAGQSYVNNHGGGGGGGGGGY